MKAIHSRAKPQSTFRLLGGALLGLLLGAAVAPAALIPGLYPTGVDNAGGLLSSNTVDPHYTLVASADAGYPGPEAYTLSPGWPVPPWLAEGPNSRWIAPRPEQNIGNAQGNYTYRTTFDLTGYDPAKAAIQGRWAVDNGGVDIVLNGVSLGIANTWGFTAFTNLTITSGFVAGINTLEFIVSNAPDTPNPTALRVEMLGTIEVEGEPPSVVLQPVSQTAVAGEDVTFTIIAIGEPPFWYQWRRNGNDLPGQNSDTLTLTGVTTNDAGQYDVVVQNWNGSTNSQPATLTVMVPLGGLFNTGVDDFRAVLPDYAVDPHYKLVVNPDSASSDALVEDSTLFPIVAGPWVANSGTSKWIGPRGDTVGAAGGDYDFQLVLDLTGLDPATCFITGLWTSDNAGSILLNGAPTGVTGAGNFDTLNAFSISSGFVSGTNVLLFRVNNASPGYIGLRVENVRGGALPAEDTNVPPRIVAQPQAQTALTGESVSFVVVADGTPPLSYQWRLNGDIIPDATSATLALTGVTTNNSGLYSVTVSSPYGTTNSVAARLTVLPPIPGLFNTGVDSSGALLGSSTPDPHYFLVISPDAAAPGPLAYTLNDAWPVAPAGPWLAEGPNSRWIAPQADQGAGNVPGTYVFVTMFNLSGFDPTTAIIRGKWAADDRVLDVVLNGVSLGLANDSGFGGLVDFTISSGFVSGENTLAVLIHNGLAVANPIGLRMELRGGAAPTDCIWPGPVAVRSYVGQNNQAVTVSIPAGLNASGDVTVTVTSGNPAVAEPVGASGGSLALVFPAGGAATRTFNVAARSLGAATFTLAGPDGVCIGASLSVVVGETLVANPSFENNYNATWPHYSSIAQWRSIPGCNPGVNEAGGPFHDNGVIPDRNRVAFIQGSGGIYQVLWGLKPGQSYWLQFRYNERAGDGGPISAAVRFNGKSLASLPDIMSVGGGNPYYGLTLPFTATAEYGLLEFATTASVDATLLLDAVTIVPRLTNEVVVMNPSFEASGVSAWPGYINPAPISGWTGVGAYGVNRSGEGPFADNGIAADQRGVLFLQSAGSGVSQTVSGLENGAVYQLSFAFNTRDCCGGAPRLTATVDGNTVVDVAVTPAGTAPFYTTNVTFTASGTTATLAFANTGEGDATVLLDDVRVAPPGAIETQLRIRYLPGSQQVRISWPAAAGLWRVEVSAALPGGFVDSGLSAVLESGPDGDEWAVYDSVAGTAFYRLAR